MMFESLRSRKWQSEQIKKHGLSYIPPNDVAQVYDELSNAAAVLGREDLAAQLKSLVTPDLIDRYAPLLLVLYGLSGNPLGTTVPSGPQFMDELNIEPPNPMSIWKEAMHGLEQPEDYESVVEDEEAYEEGHGMNSGDEDDDGTTITPQHTLSDDKFEDEDSEFCSGDEVILISKYWPRNRQAVTTELPLTHRQMVRELVLLLQNLPTVDQLYLKGTTKRCSNSVVLKFTRTSERLHSMELTERNLIMDRLRSLSTPSIIRLTHQVETILYEFHVVKGQRQVDITAIQFWIDSNASLFSEFPVWVQQLKNLTSEYDHPNLIPAFAYYNLSKLVYNTQPKKIATSTMPLKRAYRWIDKAFIVWGSEFMELGFRQCLLDTWSRLASIYLAQDPRVLVFIESWLELQRTSNSGSTPDADTLFQNIRADQRVSFSQDFFPRVEVSLPAPLEDVFGPNLQSIFRPEELKKCWASIISAFIEQDFALELEMSSLTADVETRIRKLKLADPRCPVL